MNEPADFERFLAGLRPEVERALDRYLPPAGEEPSRLHEAMRYAVFAGGKRVRPALVVLGGEAFGAQRALLLPVAAAVELIHTFSLVHDDLPALDNDDVRRGRPTLHKQYDEALAILAGDALLALGLQLLAEEPASAAAVVRVEAVSWVARAVSSRGMIGGQVADLMAERTTPNDAEAALLAIHRRKTGELLRVSLRLGGLYAAVPAAGAELLDTIGERIGLMFQIGDDILDVLGDTATLGKTAGKDAQAEKLTYPRVYGLPVAKRKLQQVYDDTVPLLARLPAGGGALRGLAAYLVTRDR